MEKNNPSCIQWYKCVGRLVGRFIWITVASLWFSSEILHCQLLPFCWFHQFENNLVVMLDSPHSRWPLIFPWEKSFGNTLCVSNMCFLKKNEKCVSRKNIIKINHFIPIFYIQKMVYFPKEKIVWKMVYFYKFFNLLQVLQFIISSSIYEELFFITQGLVVRLIDWLID